jgi:hypothetical protein
MFFNTSYVLCLLNLNWQVVIESENRINILSMSFPIVIWFKFTITTSCHNCVVLGVTAYGFVFVYVMSLMTM